jgi:hypothetical protein
LQAGGALVADETDVVPFQVTLLRGHMRVILDDADRASVGPRRTTRGKFSAPYEYRRENNGSPIGLTDR